MHSTKRSVLESDESLNLEDMKAQGWAIKYACLSQPIAPGPDKEPVTEFRITPGKHTKYSVDSMLFVPGLGIIFEAYGVKDQGITESYVRNWRR